MTTEDRRTDHGIANPSEKPAETRKWSDRWRSELDSIRNRVRGVIRRIRNQPGDPSAAEQAIRDYLQEQNDLLRVALDGDEGTREADEATYIQKLAYQVMEAARGEGAKAETRRGKFEPVVTAVVYDILYVALLDEGLPPAAARILAGTLQRFVHQRLTTKVGYALDELERLVDKLSDVADVERDVKAKLKRAITAARAARRAQKTAKAGQVPAEGDNPEAAPSGNPSPDSPPSQGEVPPVSPPEGSATTDEDEARVEALKKQLEEARRDIDSEDVAYVMIYGAIQPTPEYLQTMRREEAARLTAPGGPEPDPGDVQRAVNDRLRLERDVDFLWDGLNTYKQALAAIHPADHDAEDKRMAASMAFHDHISSLNTKYDFQGLQRLLSTIQRTTFRDFFSRTAGNEVEEMLNYMRREGQPPLPAEHIATIHALANAETALERIAQYVHENADRRGAVHAADGTITFIAADYHYAWERFSQDVMEVIERIMSNQSPPHNESFRMNTHEDRLINSLTGRLRRLGAEISDALEARATSGAGALVVSEVPFDQRTTVNIVDVDKDYGLRTERQQIGYAVERWLSAQVSSLRQRVEAMHNMTYAINQGAGLEKCQEFARGLLQTQFVQRLFMTNPEYALAEQEYLRVMGEDIARNNNRIPDNFGDQTSAGMDRVDETTVLNLMSLMPQRSGESSAQHRNRVLQAFRAGKVIAWVYTADAFNLLKYALPSVDQKEVDDDGDVVEGIRARKTFSRTYLAVAPSIIPFFYQILYKSPPHLSWMPRVYIPKDLDSYVVRGGRAREGFSPVRFMRWKKEMDNAEVYGASEDLLTEFYPNYDTLMEVEDPKYLGATQSGSIGDSSEFKLTLPNGTNEDVLGTIDNLRRVGTAHVYGYVNSKLEWFAAKRDANSAITYDYTERSRADGRMSGRQPPLRELQDAYLQTKEDYDDALFGRWSPRATGRMTARARRALVQHNEAKKALLMRIVELEVTEPLRDVFPSSMVTGEKKKFTHEFEVHSGLYMRDRLTQHTLATPAVQVFVAAHGAEAQTLVEAELIHTALNAHAMLEGMYVQRVRNEYDTIVDAARAHAKELRNQGRSQEADAHVLQETRRAQELCFSPDRYVFRTEAELSRPESQEALRRVFAYVESVSRSRNGLSLGDIFLGQDGADQFVGFMRSFSRELQLSIGDLHVAAAADLNVRQDGDEVVRRYETYGRDDNGRTISQLLRERRRSNGRKKAAEAAGNQEEVRKIEVRQRELDQEIAGWMDARRGTLRSDSVARRVAWQIVEKRGPIETEMFNRDQAMEKVNWSKKVGSYDFAEKQVGNGLTEAGMVEKSTKMWLEAAEKFVRTAESGEKGLGDALGGFSGLLQEYATMCVNKDANTAPMLVVRRLEVIRRLIMASPYNENDPDARGLNAEVANLRARRPNSLMGFAIGDPTYAATTADIGFISQSLLTKLTGIRIPLRRWGFVRSRREEFIPEHKQAASVISGAVASSAEGLLTDTTDSMERFAHRARTLADRVERYPGVEVLGRGLRRIGDITERIAHRIPDRADTLRRMLSGVLSRVPALRATSRILPEYRDMGASLELIQDAQATRWTDRTRIREEFPSYIASGLAAIILFAMWVNDASKKK